MPARPNTQTRWPLPPPRRRRRRPRAHTHARRPRAAPRAAPTARRRPPPRARSRHGERYDDEQLELARVERVGRAPTEPPPPHCGTAAAVETNLETFTSASGGVRNEPAPPHRSRKRRRARRSRASTRRPPPRHCAKSAGAAAEPAKSSAALTVRLWVGHTAAGDACIAQRGGQPCRAMSAACGEPRGRRSAAQSRV